VQVQVGQRTGDVLVTVFVRATLAAALQRQLWDSLHDLITGLFLHVKTRETPELFDGTTSHIAGTQVMHERVGPWLFRIEPQAFFQVNTVQMERLYALVQAAAALQGHEIVFDLYSGGGTIALSLAPYCKTVYGVEVQRQATLLAIQQAAAQGCAIASFAPASWRIYNATCRGTGRVAVLNPPRRVPLKRSGPRAYAGARLVYVSCSPPTLARDLRLLHDLGYRTTAVQPLDMFSQTYHIECVATLHRG
jgi:23S rRNA (uracil1939-C5)-methyltransferase